MKRVVRSTKGKEGDPPYEKFSVESYNDKVIIERKYFDGWRSSKMEMNKKEARRLASTLLKLCTPSS